MNKICCMTAYTFAWLAISNFAIAAKERDNLSCVGFGLTKEADI